MIIKYGIKIQKQKIKIFSYPKHKVILKFIDLKSRKKQIRKTYSKMKMKNTAWKKELNKN